MEGEGIEGFLLSLGIFLVWGGFGVGRILLDVRVDGGLYGFRVNIKFGSVIFKKRCVFFIKVWVEFRKCIVIAFSLFFRGVSIIVIFSWNI